MSEANKGPDTVPAESLSQIGGGECTPQQYVDIISQLADSYNTLVEFTSYVMGRVAGDE
jgi:hypothetical protein